MFGEAWEAIFPPLWLHARFVLFCLVLSLFEFAQRCVALLRRPFPTPMSLPSTSSPCLTTHPAWNARTCGTTKTTTTMTGCATQVCPFVTALSQAHVLRYTPTRYIKPAQHGATAMCRE